MTAAIETLDAIGATYAVLSKAFGYPNDELWAQLEGRTVSELSGDVVDDDADGLDRDYVFPVRSQDERASIYLSLFEVGEMPLYEGSFRPRDGRDGIQEELLRFYHYFAVRLSERNRDFPDHVVTELEFMMHLVGLEAAALKAGRDPTSFRLAQRDFLDRHVLVWATEMKKRRFGDDRGVYSTLASWLGAFTRVHREVVGDALAEVGAVDERPIGDTNLERGD
ncbi:MAG: molecular chaperone TorD family protein [Alphaproteobacteria bacterium]|nr:molecular chaperone TorD family protein [Alphaproteobacteria bacterium]